MGVATPIVGKQAVAAGIDPNGRKLSLTLAANFHDRESRSFKLAVTARGDVRLK